MPSEGEWPPLVTSPTVSPPWMTGLPGRAMPLPSILKGASLRRGPAARISATAVAPTNPVASLQAQPRPASIGLVSGGMSLPCHRHGNDISPETNPIEAGLGWACKEATGFVGATAVAEIRAAGPRRKLAPFKIEGKGIARPGNPVIQGGETVGEVTSGGHSPSLGIGVGLAYLPPELAE